MVFLYPHGKIPTISTGGYVHDAYFPVSDPVAVIPLALSEPQTASAATAIPAPPKALADATVRRGQYFAYPAPAGWQTTENANSVLLVNPDGSEALAFAGLEGTPGSSSPRRQFELLLSLSKMRNVVVSDERRRPFQNGFDTTEFLLTFTDEKGRACKGWVWTAVNNSYSRNNTYRAIAWATGNVWPRDAQFLVAMARLIKVINPEQAFQRDQLIRNNIAVGPGSAGGFNHPNTFTPNSNQAAMDRISDRNARARRDDYPLVDSSTGTAYHGNSNNYDYVRGGWPNPKTHRSSCKWFRQDTSPSLT